jgi:hypothetical protein
MPVTTPDVALTVAIARSLLLQVPEAVALLSVVVRPGHTSKVPVIGAGEELTVAVVVAGVVDVVQPSRSVTVSVYTPEAAGRGDVITGLSNVLLNPPGPDQL